MARVPGWEKRLNAVVAKHQALPSQYGVSDCYIIPDDAVEAVTGERMYPDALGYRTDAGAAKKLRQHGFATVRDAFAAKYPEIPPAIAQRGDIGVIDRDGVLSGGLFTSIGFMTRGVDTVEFLPASAVAYAFKVN
ncbi:hypothetical protein QO004_000075 [Rhizobium mesoamericanum]|uniref:DUF6950 family protein n=1 Tax=Rhizobium mesoamericanum TaxID=1079800 RepID=UPI002789CA6A|nr:hypothetical protein [Rhizobium mesoamericanum]MDQ0558302.1 hypothetical protein [Rhizobium mesoamericanum]